MKYFLTILVLLLSVITSSAQSNEVDNPVKNFESLWTTFNERYANFELKKIDWDEVYQRYRPQVSERMTNLELFEICCSMVQELSDGHVGIEPDFDDSDVDCGPPYLFVYDELIQSQEDLDLFESAMEGALTTHRFSKKVRPVVSEATNFQYRTSDQFGYLRVDEMTEDLKAMAIIRAMNSAMDQAMNAFKNKDGVIIDLRLNGGGWDHVGTLIANRFVSEKRVGHYKKKRIKGTSEFSKLKSCYLEPRGDYQFTKPIVILVSDLTASAAEVFLLGLKDLPYVTIIGDTTEGIFSDMYEFDLPNGWEVSLSNMQFFDANMNNYEGVGIEPDTRVINSKKEMEQKKDGVIDKAVEVLMTKIRE